MSTIQLEQINLNLLLVLDALLQTRSVTGAARTLSVTPSAVSHNLRALRELLDDPLLVRGRGGLNPTPRADAIREPLRLALFQVEEALRTAPFQPHSAVRRFVLAVPDFLGHVFATRVLREITEEWTGIDLDVLPSARAENAWRLETGELSLAIGGLLPAHPGMHRLVLYEEDLVLVVRAAHPLASSGIDLRAYGGCVHALVGLEDRYDPMDTLVDRQLAELGLSRRIAVRQRSFFGTLHTILETDLVTILPRTITAWAVSRFDIRVFPLPFPLATYAEEMMWHRRFDADVGHRWLRERIVEASRTVRAELLEQAGDRLPAAP